MVVDLDAFDANADDLVRRARGLPIRVASKSLRIPALLRRALAHDGFSGVLSYTLAEALWLEGEGVTDDLVVAYPTVDRGALARLVASPAAAGRITLMVDALAHLDVIDSVRSSPRRPGPGRDRHRRRAVGRRPARRPEAVAAARRIRGARPRHARSPSAAGFRLVGVMTYEGQVAGVADDVPTQRARSAVVRRLKALSLTQLETRRAEIAAGLRDLVELEFWNAGGSGSVQDTASDPVVTEIAAGSGLLVPTLFDHYRSFEPRPASYFGLPVTRRPSPTIATVHGGGLVASGPIGADRLPTPWAPAGLHVTGLEGAGEVQTPLTGKAAAMLEIGDLVWFRHAKSGEPFEHSNTVQLLAGAGPDARFVEEALTYRGHGLAF